MSYDVPEDAESESASPARSRRTPRRQTGLDEVANDLAYWIDDVSTKVALAFAPGRAPFSADLTEDQKLDYYTRALFNPDGTPNTAGRNREVARLGVERFAQVYQKVIAAHPEWKPPANPMMEVPNG